MKGKKKTKMTVLKKMTGKWSMEREGRERDVLNGNKEEDAVLDRER